MDLLVQWLNLSPHIDNDLSETKSLLFLQTSLEKQTFYKFLNIVHLRFLFCSTMKTTNNSCSLGAKITSFSYISGCYLAGIFNLSSVSLIHEAMDYLLTFLIKTSMTENNRWYSRY